MSLSDFVGRNLCLMVRPAIVERRGIGTITFLSIPETFCVQPGHPIDADYLRSLPYVSWHPVRVETGTTSKP